MPFPSPFPISGTLETNATSSLRSSSLGSIKETTGAPGAINPSSSTSFDDILSQISSKAIQDLKTSEQVSAAGLQGKASTQQVVEAVLTAERSLQTALAIRDKAVDAYKQIVQTPI